jgi:hypothetical protein
MTTATRQSLSDLSLRQLLQMLHYTERAAGSDCDGARLIRRAIEARGGSGRMHEIVPADEQEVPHA